MISNCIIQGTITYGNNLSFCNNVFLHSYGSSAYNFTNIKSCDVNNNVFLRRGSYMERIQYGCFGVFSYNLFTAAIPNFDTNTTATGSYLGVTADDIFEDADNNVFDYTKDYHLQDPETYLGMDGKEVGIYGGALGCKPGAVPSNPHFSSATIAPTTDGDGKLNVNIKVIAQ